MAATAPQQLSQLFAIPVSKQPAQWDSCYRTSFHPWDRSGPSLALGDLLLQRPDLVPSAIELDSRSNPLRSSTGTVIRKTALVPGCGLGHDVRLLASFGYDVWALDVSETAIGKAKEQKWESLYKENEGNEMGRITWVAADFFKEEWVAGTGTDGSGKFDLIFDYTFLCALPTDLRPKWAQRITDLLTSKGRLVCLEFPVGKPLSDDGPPWGLCPEVYEALLAAPGEPIDYAESGDGSIVDIPCTKPHENAIHRLSLIKPPRTHKAGTNEDGSVRDFISVWSR